MPIYEYECNKCLKRFEVKRSFNESGGNICPRCGSEGRQIIFPAPLHFKGSGFYITDSQKNIEHSTDGGQPTKPDTGKPAATPDKGKPTTKPDLSKPIVRPESGKPMPRTESDKQEGKND